jgi:hypothetical protein
MSCAPPSRGHRGGLRARQLRNGIADGEDGDAIRQHCFHHL